MRDPTPTPLCRLEVPHDRITPAGRARWARPVRARQLGQSGRQEAGHAQPCHRVERAAARRRGRGGRRVIIARAVDGDPVAGRFLFERLDPKPRGRPIALPCAAGTLAERFAAVFAAVATGEITPDEALALGRLLDLERKAIGAAASVPAAAPAPELTPDEREAAVHAELAAVFGEAALAPRAKPAPGSVEPAEPLQFACISTPEDATAPAPAGDPPPAPKLPAEAQPPPRQAAPGGVTKRRLAYWQGSARRAPQAQTRRDVDAMRLGSLRQIDGEALEVFELAVAERVLMGWRAARPAAPGRRRALPASAARTGTSGRRA